MRPSKNVGYENFTNLSTTVSQSSSVNLTVSVNTDGNYRADAIAWIDWNQDGDFTDNGETYDLGNISNVSNGALATKSVAVPSNAKVGATRMRVSARYNANPTSCQTNFDGEVEDYTVNVQGAVADTQAPSAPNSLTASSITQTTLTLNWSSSTDNVGVTGYDVYRGSTKLGSTTTATSYNVIGLTANTAYSFTVRAKDASGNISSSSNTASVTTLGVVVSYCASKGNRDTYEWIDYVSFGGMTNTTGKNGGYGDFTSKVATVAQGSTNQLLVSAGFRSSAYNEYFTIWIDYNKNGTFESNEKVASGNSTSSGNRSSNITIPSSASLGQTRMRVSMKYNGASTACETFADGEVEDYTVNITANTSKGTSISNIETLRDESGLDLMVYPNPTTNFIEVNVASKSDNITYSVVNTIGSVVKSGKMISRTLDVSNLKSGVYMIEVNDGQKSLRTKFIKK
ncbi:GEVED domain-containing protein [Tenacibaculum sp. nBUS_03]|uniref:GEVED domain-containing protein n=1 Tax=Tenacibaculum sp. nBUS_03 TaxID=3395320 RepID=UPI003EC10AC2